MGFTTKDWRDSPGDLTTPITAVALEDLEARTTAGIPFENVLWHGAVGNNTGDQTAAIQAANDAVAAAGGGVLFFPTGVYRHLGPLTYSPKVSWMGAGMDATWLECPTSLGAGVYALSAEGLSAGSQSPYYHNTISGIFMRGPAADIARTYGTASTDMHGLKIGSRTTVDHCRIWGFYNGCAIAADHATLMHSQIILNHDNLAYTAAATWGDQVVFDCDLNGASMSSVCVGQGSMMDAGLFQSVHLGGAPYGIRSTPGRTGITDFLSAMVFIDVMFEWYGNAAIFAGNTTDTIKNCQFIGGGAWSQLSAAEIVGVENDYIIDGGALNNTIFDNPQMFWTPRRIRSRGNDLGGLRFPSLALDAFGAAAGSPILVKSNGDRAMFCTWKTLEASGYFAQTDVAVVRGQLMRTTGGDVSLWTSAGDVPAGFAMHAAGIGEIVAVGTLGYFADAIAGAAIASGKYLKPSTAVPGRVLQATDYSDGPAVGVALGGAAGAASTVVTQIRVGGMTG